MSSAICGADIVQAATDRIKVEEQALGGIEREPSADDIIEYLKKMTFGLADITPDFICFKKL